MKMDKNLNFCEVFPTQNPVNNLSRAATADRTLLDFGMALSTALLIAVTIKSVNLSRSLGDRCH